MSDGTYISGFYGFYGCGGKTFTVNAIGVYVRLLPSVITSPLSDANQEMIPRRFN